MLRGRDSRRLACDRDPLFLRPVLAMAWLSRLKARDAVFSKRFSAFDGVSDFDIRISDLTESHNGSFQSTEC
jgi:hypothetical protein